MPLRPHVLLLVLATAACASQQPEPAPARTVRAPSPVPREPVRTTQPQPARVPVYDQRAPVRGGDVVLEVRGLTCPIKCVRQVKAMLSEAPGVKSVRVDYDAKAAIVSVEPGTDPESLTRYVRPPYSAYVVSAVTVGSR